MTPSKVQSLHQAAQVDLRAGRRQEAAAIFEQIIFEFPNYAPAHFMLGVIANDAGNPAVALPLLNKAIAIDPAFAEPYFLSGFILYQQRQLPAAIAAYRKYLNLRPNDGKALNNLGRALLDSKQLDEAFATLRLAIAAAPNNAGAHSNLGDAFRQSGDLDAAILQYRKAISVDEKCAEAHGNLGIVLAEKKQIAQSIASLQKALAINPRMYNPRFNLARVLQDAGMMDQAYKQCLLAIEQRPHSSEARNMLGNILGLTGDVSRCIEQQRQAVELDPTHAGLHSNLLLSLQYRDDLSPDQRLAEHRRWNAQHIPPFTPTPPANRGAAGRLHIGYVSPNFQTHSVGYFLESVLASHDHDVVEIYCYSNTKNTDSTTDRMRASADHWRDILGKTDSQVAQLIRQDNIDILVDLAGHTSHNRLTVFGFKPAPIQMTWLGYPDTTGMLAMDYRLTDSIADPPGDSDRMHTEKLLRLNGSCWAYAPAESTPPPAPPPWVANGFVTFGSFNNLPKVTPQVLQTWATILNQVADCRLVIKAAGLYVGNMGRDYLSGQLQQFGADLSRVELLNFAPTTTDHLELYQRVDIALDTFPYNGTTTTCEALWMGVPVITFPGNRHVSRVGTSLLTHAGCKEWIARDVEGYITMAVQMANEPQQLIEIRRNLRTRLQQSPLCDAQRMARELERVFMEVHAKLPTG